MRKPLEGTYDSGKMGRSKQGGPQKEIWCLGLVRKVDRPPKKRSSVVETLLQTWDGWHGRKGPGSCTAQRRDRQTIGSRDSLANEHSRVIWRETVVDDGRASVRSNTCALYIQNAGWQFGR